MEDWRENWRSRLREAIDPTRRTQASIALQAGVSPETLCRVLSGRHGRPSFETVVSVIYAAGENVAWILREPETFLSSDDSKRMREIIGFLEENFAPMEWPISLLD